MGVTEAVPLAHPVAVAEAQPLAEGEELPVEHSVGESDAVGHSEGDGEALPEEVSDIEGDCVAQVVGVHDALAHAEGDPEALPLTLALPLMETVLQVLAEGEGDGEALLVVVTEMEGDCVSQVVGVYDTVAHAEGDPEALPLTRALPLYEAEAQLLAVGDGDGEALLVDVTEIEGDCVEQVDGVYDTVAHAEGDPEAAPLALALPL